MTEERDFWHSRAMKSWIAVLIVSLGMASPLWAEPKSPDRAYVVPPKTPSFNGVEDSELFTYSYVVPPNFLSTDPGGVDAPAEPPAPRTAKEILESVGVTFGPGAAAIYIAEHSKLIVRNTKDQLELVELFVQSLSQPAENQIYVTVREASIQGELPEHLKNTLSSFFDFQELPTWRKEGEQADVFDSRESFVEELARPPKPMEEGRAERRIQVARTLTDPQFQVLIRSLEEIEGIEILSAPSVMARSGNPVITRAEQRRYGIVPAIGADGLTIDLDLFLPEHGKALSDEGAAALKPTITATVWDGGTVVVAEKNANGDYRLVFVKAHIMDAAGTPIQKPPTEAPQEEAVELPAKFEPEMFTTVYVVPPGFLNPELGPVGGWKPKSQTLEERYQPKEPVTAKSVLEKAGVTFGSGASAIYNPATGKLIVRNTQDQMELVEAYIESLVQGGGKQIYVTIHEARFHGELSDHLKQEPDAESSAPKPGKLPIGVVTDLVVSKLFEFSDSGREPSYIDSYESLRDELARPPMSADNLRQLRQIQSTDVLTDPQFQVAIRRLRELDGLDLQTLPATMVRSGQPGLTAVERRRYGFVVVLDGEEERKIDLDLFLPEHGKALFEPGSALRPTVKVSVLDGSCAVVAERKADGENRLVFIRTQIMDPAGMPYYKDAPEPPQEKSPQEEAVELPSWSEPETLGAKEMEAVNRAAASRIHVVREGETLEQIAGRFGVGVEALRAVNRLDGGPLKTNQILLVPQGGGESRTEALLKSLVLHGVDFNEATLLEALAMLREEIVRLHDPGLFPDATPFFVIDAPEEILEAKITLRLSNVPVAEALRYTTSLANCRYTVEGREIRILPQGASAE